MPHITVMEWQQVLLFSDGRLARTLGTGRHRYRKDRDKPVAVDMRPQQLALPGQEMLTADGVTIRISLVITWRVTDPVRYITAAENARNVMYGAAQIAIRDGVAALPLTDALSGRRRMSEPLADAVRETAAGVGIEVTEIVVRDIMPPGELRRAAMDEVLARTQGRAELERARAEAAVLRSLANTARLLEEHPALLQLRTVQAATGPGSKIVLAPPGTAAQ